MKCAVTVKSITRLVEVGMADTIVSEINRIEAENARLKAEAENSKRINTELLVLSNRQASDIRRLHKAGDAMADWFTHNDCRECRNDCQGWLPEAWNAAKEGKPSV